MREEPPPGDKYEVVETLLEVVSRNRYATADTLERELVERRGWTRARLERVLASLKLAIVRE
jgi:hypothetical protein